MARKRRTTYKGNLVKGMLGNLPGEMLLDPVFENTLKQMLRGRGGIYALYKGGKLYYIGLAKSLFWRTRDHLKDKHARKWDTFRVFIIRRPRYIKDIETLFLNVALPPGNTVSGHFPREANLNHVLRDVLREHQKKIKAVRKALR